MKKPPLYGLLVAVAFWLMVMAGGMSALLRYSVSPGPGGVVPKRWPADSHISFEASKPNLVLFAHPRCPCTQATLGELEILMTQCHGRLSAQVWFIKPKEVSGDWLDTALWRRARSIPGVTVHRDEDLTESRRFGAGTSGLTLVYDPDGHLLFQGGITISRGHSGENPGRSAIVAVLDRKSSLEIRTPVFGCPLFATDCQPQERLCKP